MDEQHETARKTDAPDPRGQSAPIDGRDRSHDPKSQPQPAGSSADQVGPDASKEARNQAATADKSRAESGTP